MEQTKINQLPQESGVSGVTCATVRAQINIKSYQVFVLLALDQDTATKQARTHVPFPLERDTNKWDK